MTTGLRDVELVTPDGRFASIRTPTVIDGFAVGFYGVRKEDIADVMLRLCILCVKLDGEKVTREMLGNLPMYELEAILVQLTSLIKTPPERKKRG